MLKKIAILDYYLILILKGQLSSGVFSFMLQKDMNSKSYLRARCDW
jgi:hypothetical protein